MARVAGRLAFAEDATFEAGVTPIDGPAVFSGGGAALSLLALGDWLLADLEWWRAFLPPGVRGGASRLRLGGVCVRVVTGTLGEALDLVDGLEVAVRLSGVATPQPAVAATGMKSR
jgi:hypothetical protein